MMSDSVFDLCPECGGRGTKAMVGIVVGCGRCGGSGKKPPETI